MLNPNPQGLRMWLHWRQSLLLKWSSQNMILRVSLMGSLWQTPNPIWLCPCTKRKLGHRQTRRKMQEEDSITKSRRETSVETNPAAPWFLPSSALENSGDFWSPELWEHMSFILLKILNLIILNLIGTQDPCYLQLNISGKMGKRVYEMRWQNSRYMSIHYTNLSPLYIWNIL